MKMGGWSSDSKMEQRSPRRCNARYEYSPWWGPADPHHGLFSLKRLCLFETVAFLGKVLVLEKYYLKGDRAWWMPAQMHPLTAESLALSGFPGKKKRTKHRHIVSMFGPIMVPLTGLEPVRNCFRQILSLLCLPVPTQRRFLIPCVPGGFARYKLFYHATRPASSTHVPGAGGEAAGGSVPARCRFITRLRSRTEPDRGSSGR